MTHKRRDTVIFIAILFIIIIGSVAGAKYPTFRLFFAWPDGGTWSNTLAWLEDGGIALLVTWYFRDNAGKNLSAWWHKHQSRHLDQRDNAMRAHISAEVLAMEERMTHVLKQHANVTVESATADHSTPDDGNMT